MRKKMDRIIAFVLTLCMVLPMQAMASETPLRLWDISEDIVLIVDETPIDDEITVDETPINDEIILDESPNNDIEDDTQDALLFTPMLRAGPELEVTDITTVADLNAAMDTIAESAEQQMVRFVWTDALAQEFATGQIIQTTQEFCNPNSKIILDGAALSEESNPLELVVTAQMNFKFGNFELINFNFKIHQDRGKDFILMSGKNDTAATLSVTNTTIETVDYNSSFAERPNRNFYQVIATKLCVNLALEDFTAIGGSEIIGPSIAGFSNGTYTVTKSKFKNVGERYICATSGNIAINITNTEFYDTNTTWIPEKALTKEMGLLRPLEGKNVTIDNCYFHDLKASSAIICPGKSRGIKVTKTTMENCKGITALVETWAPNVKDPDIITNCYFYNNEVVVPAGSTDGVGGIVRIGGASVDVAMRDCFFENNCYYNQVNASSADGAAIYYRADSCDVAFTLSGNTFKNNRAGDDGAAVYIENFYGTGSEFDQIVLRVFTTTSRIVNNTFIRNVGEENAVAVAEVEDGGGAVQIAGSVDSEVIHNTFYGNYKEGSTAGAIAYKRMTPTRQGRVLIDKQSVPAITAFYNNLFTDNTAGPDLTFQQVDTTEAIWKCTPAGNVGLDDGTENKVPAATVFPMDGTVPVEESTGAYVGCTLAGKTAFALPVIRIAPRRTSTGLAHNAGDNTYASATYESARDQIGTPRVDGKPDAGAIELFGVTAPYNVYYEPGTTDTVTNLHGTDIEYEGATYPVSTMVPSRSGYTFLGWTTTDVTGEAQTYQKSNTFVMPARNVTLTAMWKIRDNPGGGGSDPTAVLIKVDATDTTQKLSGAKFELYRKAATASGTDTLVGTYTTDANGKIQVTAKAGDYYWLEILAPTGYKLDETKHAFTLSGSSTTTVTVKNSVNKPDEPDKPKVPEWLNGDDHFAYVVGYPDGNVRPQGNITRAEVATIFFRLLKDAVRDKYLVEQNAFTDVVRDNWFNTAVSTMSSMTIVKGDLSGTFRPDDNITRAEFAAIAARFDGTNPATTSSFNDVAGHWAEREIAVAAANGWIEGYTDGSFKPDARITRAEAMMLINRVLQRLPESPSDLLSNMIKWPDNAETNAWFYLAVQEATNSHNFERKTNGFEHWTTLRDNKDWVSLYEK